MSTRSQDVSVSQIACNCLKSILRDPEVKVLANSAYKDDDNDFSIYTTPFFDSMKTKQQDSNPRRSLNVLPTNEELTDTFLHNGLIDVNFSFRDWLSNFAEVLINSGVVQSNCMSELLPICKASLQFCQVVCICITILYTFCKLFLGKLHFHSIKCHSYASPPLQN